MQLSMHRFASNRFDIPATATDTRFDPIVRNVYQPVHRYTLQTREKQGTNRHEVRERARVIVERREKENKYE